MSNLIGKKAAFEILRYGFDKINIVGVIIERYSSSEIQYSDNVISSNPSDYKDYSTKIPTTVSDDYYMVLTDGGQVEHVKCRYLIQLIDE